MQNSSALSFEGGAPRGETRVLPACAFSNLVLVCSHWDGERNGSRV